MKQKLKALLTKIKNALFYKRWTCNICNKDIFDNGHICESCKQNAPYIKTYCLHCGRKTQFTVKYCNTCINNLTEINVGRSVFSYEYPINALIKKFKYKGAKYLEEFFGEELYTLYKNCPEIKSDVCVFVPMTEKSFKERGYNQSQLLAERFCKLSNLPLIADAIKKVKDTKRQATLSRIERTINLKGVYRFGNKKQIKGKTVLVIDDVATTGTTLENIAKLLKKMGALKVNVLTVASVSVDNITV